MRLKPLLFAAVVVLACGAYTAWWLHAAGLVRERIEAWAADERARAGLVEYRDLAVGGFPLRLAAGASDVDIRRPDGLEWRAARVEASAAPWNLSRIALVLPGEQRVRLSAGGGGSAAGPGVRLVAREGEGTIEVERGRAAAVRLSLDEVVLSPEPGPGASPRDRAVLAGRMDVAVQGPASGPDAGLAASVVASLVLDDVTLPDGLAAPLGA
ncbi:MAG TPA: DUF2125 domain-containing protein, partial [Arenibaculum sp.]|nr:DUF2125 domain-containing protein [Arenibaculum sp.]